MADENSEIEETDLNEAQNAEAENTAEEATDSSEEQNAIEETEESSDDAQAETDEAESDDENILEAEVEQDVLDEILQGDVAVEVEIDGDLELKEVIGEGVYGPVFRVGDPAGTIDFAVKALPAEISNDPDQLDKVKESFTQASYLNHPNIACVSYLHEVVTDSPMAEEMGVHNGAQLVVMEYVEGETVTEWSKQFSGSKLDFDSAITICSQVADALDYAHTMGMTHRALKPENTMITMEGKVKLLDFGISAQVHSAMSRFKGAHSDKVPTNFAPEQWTGKRPGPGCDQYALATMFYQLVTGEVPFASALDISSDAYRNCIVNDQPDKPAELTDTQWNALLRAFAKTPAERYTNCAEFISALENNDEAVTAIDISNPVVLRFVALAIAAIIILFALFSGGDAPEEDSLSSEESASQSKVAQAPLTDVTLEEPKVIKITEAEVVKPVETAPEVVKQNPDIDGDGIPNEVELAFGLNPNDKADALLDADKDGFSTIAEYSGMLGSIKLDKKTDPKDPKSHPSLSYLLKIASVTGQTPLPIAIQKADTMGDNQKVWAVLIKYAHPKGVRSEYMSIGDTVELKDKKYTLKDIKKVITKKFDKQINSNKDLNESVVTFKQVDGKHTVTATVGNKVFDARKSAELLDSATGMTHKVHQYETITLGNAAIGIETFTVTKIDEKKSIVVLLTKNGKALYTIETQK